MVLNDYVELNPRVSIPKDEQVPFVSMDVVVPGNRWVYHNQERLATGSGSKFAPGDTLFARITPCLENGKIAQYAGNRPGIGSTEFFVLRARANISDPGYVYYFSQSRELRFAAEKSMSGASGRQRAVISALSDFQCQFPPLPVQRRIAGILSAYDDLIENNQRRIAVLEKMARSLYREWFVHFRYPGHEGVPLVDSALGQIPQGWEVRKLGDLTTYLNRGLAPSYDHSGNSVIINQKCIRDQRLNLEPARPQSKLIPLEKKVKFGDVLINSTGVGTLGRVAQVYQMLEEYTVDTHVTIARPNTKTDLHFFGCTLLSLQETFDRLGVGATGQTELSRTSIANVDLVVPPKFIQGEFGNIVHSIRMEVMAYTNQTQNLRRTRDLLLPRLLSGQLDVGAVE